MPSAMICQRGFNSSCLCFSHLTRLWNTQISLLGWFPKQNRVGFQLMISLTTVHLECTFKKCTKKIKDERKEKEEKSGAKLSRIQVLVSIHFSIQMFLWARFNGCDIACLAAFATYITHSRYKPNHQWLIQQNQYQGRDNIIVQKQNMERGWNKPVWA